MVSAQEQAWEYIDGFAGGGGWSLGLERGGQYHLVAAINHEPTAVKNHKANFPLADHFCHNMQETHPSIYPKTPVLVMSPSCTNHSKAKGQACNDRQPDLWQDDPTDQGAEKSRALMEQVIHYTRQHQYEMVFVENVVEVHKWAHFQRWLQEMADMGYSHKFLYFNSMFFGVPQSRDRFYAVFWAKGVDAPDLEFRPDAHCPKCDKTVQANQSWKNGKTWGIYGANGQYWYACPHCNTVVHPATVPASTVIDTTNIGTRIKDRKTPLVDNTLNRIRAGIYKLGREYQQFGVSYYGRENTEFRLDDPLPTMTAGGNRHALITLPCLLPKHISSQYGSSTNGNPTTLDKPLWTLSTRQHHALITPTVASDDTEEIVQNCYFRFLTVKETQRAMGFPDNYIMEDMPIAAQMKILGNAVVPAVAAWIGERGAESLGRKMVS